MQTATERAKTQSSNPLPVLTPPSTSSTVTPPTEMARTIVPTLSIATPTAIKAWERKMTESTSVESSFSAKSVLITGVTGFLGKFLLEKVLRTMPSVKRIYLLIRGDPPKVNAFAASATSSTEAKLATHTISSADARLRDEVLSDRLFDNVKTMYYAMDKSSEDAWQRMVSTKIVCVTGNIETDRLGVSDAHWKELTSEVQVILNCAAYTLFGMRLDDISRSNVRGPMRLLELAKECTRLESFVQVSTAYVNSNQPHNSNVEEKLYDLPIDVNRFYAALCHGCDLTDFETAFRSRGWPNTYTISKAIGERLLFLNAGAVPLAIVRPTLVTCTMKENKRWIGSLGAGGGIFLGMGTGVIKVFSGADDGRGDFVPVDYVINVILAAAASAAKHARLRAIERTPKTEVGAISSPLIYHASTSASNPKLTYDIFKSVITYFFFHRPEFAVGLFMGPNTTDVGAFKRALWRNYDLPLFFLNTCCSFTSACRARNQFFGKMSKFVQSMLIDGLHFMHNTQRFDDTSASALLRSLPPDEQRAFWHFHPAEIEWNDFAEMICIATEQFYTIREAAKKHKRRQNI